MFHAKNIVLAVLALLFFFGCTRHDEKGSKNNPILISLVPTKESGSLLMAGDELRKYLQQKTGYAFEVNVPNNYVAVVEALGSKRADVAFLTTGSFALALKKYKIEAKFISVGADGKTTYRGQFIAPASSKITDIKQLNGKKIAFVDPSSASGYILAASLLKQKNIKPSEIVFAGKHDAVVTMVYQGQVEAGATFYSPPENGVMKDARRLVKEQYPDVESKIKILGFTDELANDALVFRADLPDEVKAKTEQALWEWSQTPEGKKSLKNLNNGAGLKKVSNADYEKDLKMLYEIEDNLKKSDQKK